jgi:hypothetical protein
MILCHLGPWCFWVYCVTHSVLRLLSVGFKVYMVALHVLIVVWDGTVGTCVGLCLNRVDLC